MKYLSLSRKFIWFALASVVLLTSTADAAPPSVVTQMYDNHHSSWNANETQLTVANVKSSFQISLQGQHRRPDLCAASIHTHFEHGVARNPQRHFCCHRE